MACGPGSPELSKSYMDMASKLFTFTFTSTVQVQWSEDVVKAEPFSGRSRAQVPLPRWLSNTMAHDHLACYP